MKYRIRFICVVNCIISLFIGVMIYCFLRSGTFFHSFASDYGITFPDYSHIHFPFDDIIRYYLTDFLWLYSMEFGVLAVILPAMTHLPVYLGTLFSFSVIYEILQMTDIISGTGDIIDISVYLSATVVVAMIYIFSIKKGKTS